ncbi:MAG: hypothetical protein AB8B85_02295 [Paracoccaceae bacterium]
MNEHAAAIADQELWAQIPSLMGQRPGMDAADAALREEWLMYYNAVDQADRERFGECAVGDAVQACPAVPVQPGWTQEGVLDILCNSEDAWVVDVLAHPDAETLRIDRLLYVDKQFPVDAAGNIIDGSAPISARVFEGGGSNLASQRLIGLLSGVSNESAATTLVHEARHQLQPPGMNSVDAEVDAYAFTEEFLIRRGMPEFREGFRMMNGAGQTIPNPDRIRDFVTATYPTEPGWVPGEEIAEGVTDMSNGWACPVNGE